uniref:Uncharacterized protein n=1 Tax=uncultured bacterium contig00100 TaxID=1181567 RepID=A0A806JZ45_9BACT|nr:hypothetical protein [uncultured bacterium contig00100]
MRLLENTSHKGTRVCRKRLSHKDTKDTKNTKELKNEFHIFFMKK